MKKFEIIFILASCFSFILKSSQVLFEGNIDKEISGSNHDNGHFYPELSQTLAVFSNDQSIASCTTKHIQVWNSTDGSLIRTLQVGDLDLFIVLQADSLVATAFGDSIKIWNSTNGELIRTMQGHLDSITYLVDLNQDKLVSGSYDQSIIVWNWKTGQRLHTFKGHKDTVTSLAVLDDEQRSLASGSRDGTIKLWNMTSFEEIMTLKAADHVNYLLALPGNLLASASETASTMSSENIIHIWSIAGKNGTIVHTIEQAHDHLIKSMILINDNVTMASASEDRTVKMWNISTGQLVTTLESKYLSFKSLALLRDGRLASGTWDDMIVIWK